VKVRKGRNSLTAAIDFLVLSVSHNAQEIVAGHPAPRNFPNWLQSRYSISLLN